MAIMIAVGIITITAFAWPFLGIFLGFLAAINSVLRELARIRVNWRRFRR